LASNPISVLAVVCLLTFLHYTAAQMRGPVLPLYAVDHGATATGVGLILGAHMIVAAVGSIPFGRASDIWGRRRFLLGGMIVSIVTSLLLPLAEDPLALMATMVSQASGGGLHKRPIAGGRGGLAGAGTPSRESRRPAIESDHIWGLAAEW
jgi:MFS family permease